MIPQKCLCTANKRCRGTRVITVKIKKNPKQRYFSALIRFFNHCIDIIHANSTQPSFILQVGLWLWLLRNLVWRGTAFGKPLSQYVSPEYCRNPCVITHVVYEQLVGIGQRQYNVHSNEHIVFKGTDIKKALK